MKWVITCLRTEEPFGSMAMYRLGATPVGRIPEAEGDAEAGRVVQCIEIDCSELPATAVITLAPGLRRIIPWERIVSYDYGEVPE